MSPKIRKLATVTAALAASLALSGCTSYHMHFSDMHLSSLNPFHSADKTAKAKQTPPPSDQTTTDQAAADQDAAAQKQKTGTQMPSEPEPLIPGKPVAQPDAAPLICKIGRGSAHFRDGWHDYRDSTFTLYDGVAGTVSLTAVHSAQTMTLQALFDKKGQKLLFCPTIDGASDGHIACTSIYALSSDLHAGIKRTFDVPAAERDGDITCAYTPDHLRTFKLPPE